MVCSKCKYKNSKEAWYCYKCGKQYTEIEKEKVNNSGLLGFMKKIKKGYDILSLGIITSKPLFKIISIIIVLGIGIWGIINNGDDLKINESENYCFEYNEKLDEYYLYTKNNETKLDLYMVGNTDSMIVSYYDEKNELISEENLNIEDIILNTNIIKDCYYVLKTNKESIKIYVYKEI